MKNNKIIIISGFSGAGKDTILSYISSKYGIKPLISYTTRPKRVNEEEGNPYYFITKEEMTLLQKNKELFELRGYHTYENNMENVWYYGIKNSQIKDDQSYVVVLDFLGTKEFNKKLPNRTIKIFLHSDEHIRRARAELRGSFEEKEWLRRLKDDTNMFPSIETSKLYNYFIDNTDLAQTKKAIDLVLEREI